MVVMLFVEVVLLLARAADAGDADLALRSMRRLSLWRLMPRLYRLLSLVVETISAILA